jgi:thiamine kinase-like enzyme
MKEEIKSYFESLNPKQVGLTSPIKVSSVKKLGMGKSNANFLVIANGKKFIFRLNIILNSTTKSKLEFDSLKLVEKLNIGPKAWLLDKSRKRFGSEIIILDYLEGKPLNETKYTINKKFIKQLVRLCIKFHSRLINDNLMKLAKDEVGYKNLIRNIRQRYFSLLRLSSNKELLKILKESLDELERNSLRKKHEHPLVLSHGDMGEQNIILHNGKMKLIDFESLGLTDPASEIAYIFTQFGNKEFKKEHQEIFLTEYLKLRKDKTLRERVEVFIPMKNFSDLLWAIELVFKTKNKLVHKHYLENNNVQKDIAYARKVFKKCLAEGTIDKKYKDFDLVGAFD